MMPPMVKQQDDITLLEHLRPSTDDPGTLVRHYDVLPGGHPAASQSFDSYEPAIRFARELALLSRVDIWLMRPFSEEELIGSYRGKEERSAFVSIKDIAG